MRVDSSPWVRRSALTGPQLNATRLWFKASFSTPLVESVFSLNVEAK